jgi:hypothetical protein
MSRGCPFCYVVHGRICVGLQHPPTYRRDSFDAGAAIHAPGPGSCPALAWVVARPGHGPRETMIAANKRRLGLGPGHSGSGQAG